MLKPVVILLLAAAMGAGGCILPIPTVPLNLPAHGHTYEVKDRNGRVAPQGILIIFTYYHYAIDRIDAYEIHDGKAVVPYTTDVRVYGMEMFGYLSWVIPSCYVFFINGHHAHVYPLVPGCVPVEDHWPLIHKERHIYGLKPRPRVLRVFPTGPAEERAVLRRVRSNVETYFIQADNQREEKESVDTECRHNEEQARRIREYVDRRLKELARPPTLPDDLRKGGVP